MIQYDKYHINVICRSCNTVILHIFVDIPFLMWYDNLIFWSFGTVRLPSGKEMFRCAASVLLQLTAYRFLTCKPFV